MRVTVICAEYPPFVQGGLGVHYQELAAELRLICQVTMIAARTSRQTPRFEEVGELAIYRVLIPRLFPFNHVVFNIKSWWLSRSLPAQVVHLCSPFGFLNLVFKKSPAVVKIHSLYKGQTGGFFYQRIIFPAAALIDKYMIERADLIMTTSTFMRDSILKQHNSVKVISIDNGISSRWLDAKMDKDKARAGVNIPESKYVILNVGRFVPRKGTLRLVQAFRKVHDKHPQAHLVLIGGGYTEAAGYESRLTDYIDAHNLEEAVTMVGWMPSEKLKPYYDAADLYFHAATYEPFGNVILEAMATGLPVIAVKAGGPEEVTGTSGVILENNDPEGMAKAIDEFITDPNRWAEYSILSLERARTFSWKKAAAETLAGYASICRGER